jgi:pimeloyl-ACP methyl ester carboxylesterase
MEFARRVLVLVIGTVLGFYLIACLVLFVAQRSLIYYPQPRSNATGSTLLTLPVGNATVAVSTYSNAGPDAVIYFGGNAEDVSEDIPYLVEAFPHQAVFGLHYPGYGGSPGSPSQRAIFTAAIKLYDHVQAEHPHIVIVGRSLGTGVATWVASERPASRLVLITPFDSLADAAAQQYPIFPVRWLLRDRFESWKYAPKVAAPTRIIVAAEDEIVPRSSSDRLRTRFTNTRVSYVVIPHAGHNTVQDSPGYWSLVSSQ